MLEKTETPQQRRDRYLRKAEEARALSLCSLPVKTRDVVLRVADDWLALAREVEIAAAHECDAGRPGDMLQAPEERIRAA